MIDFSWMSNGGLLLDSTGDISLTSSDGLESLYDMVRTRVKATVDGWQLYSIGAGLTKFMGESVTSELELAIKRSVSNALTNEFLATGSFDIKTIHDGGSITILIYISNTLITKVTVSQDSSSIVVE